VASIDRLVGEQDVVGRDASAVVPGITFVEIGPIGGVRLQHRSRVPCQRVCIHDGDVPGSHVDGSLMESRDDLGRQPIGCPLRPPGRLDRVISNPAVAGQCPGEPVSAHIVDESARRRRQKTARQSQLQHEDHRCQSGEGGGPANPVAGCGRDGALDPGATSSRLSSRVVVISKPRNLRAFSASSTGQ
jgi:hypothetical protein